MSISVEKTSGSVEKKSWKKILKFINKKSMKNELENNLNILISFKSIDEVSEECLKYVDILDLKDPDKGAIGSWEINNLKKIICKFGNKIKISATLGDEEKVYKKF